MKEVLDQRSQRFLRTLFPLMNQLLSTLYFP